MRGASIVKPRLCRFSCVIPADGNAHAELEVHHIIPLSVDVDLAHEPDNLATLCRYHHKMAHDDKIGADELKAIVSIPPAPLTLNFSKSSTPHSHLNMRGRKKF